MKKILKISILLLMLFNVSNLSLARRTRVVQDVYWELDYSINKYGENDKIIGAYCGQYGLKNKIYIDENGITISQRTDYVGTKIDGLPVKISFLFDSQNEIVVENVEKIKIDSGVYTKGYFISKDNPKFKALFNKIKQSNYMSILIEEGNGATDRMVEVSNRYSSEVLGELENSLNIF